MAVGHKRHCLFESVMQSKSNKCIMHIDMPPPPFGSIGRRQARARGANNRVDLQIFLSPSHIGADHGCRIVGRCLMQDASCPLVQFLISFREIFAGAL